MYNGAGQNSLVMEHIDCLKTTWTGTINFTDFKYN